MNFSLSNYVYVTKTGGNAEKQKNKKEPWGRSEPLVELPSDDKADDDGHDNGNTYARDHAKGLYQVLFVIIHQTFLNLPANAISIKIL
jgi:hypothetical protein